MMNADLFRLVYSLLMAVGQQPVKEGVSEYYMQSSGSSSAQQRFTDFVSKRSDPMWFQQDMQDSRESRAYIANKGERMLEQHDISSLFHHRQPEQAVVARGSGGDTFLFDDLLAQLRKGPFGNRILANMTGIGSVPILPQFDSAAHRFIRKAWCTGVQARYKYDYNTGFKDAPVLAHDPITKQVIVEEIAAFEYLKVLATRLLQIFGDTVKADIEEILENPLEIGEVLKRMSETTFRERPTKLNDYATKVFDKEMMPTSTKDYMLDEAFARWRLAGPNPVQIEPARREVIERKINMASLSPKWQRRIQKAFNEKRLFICDYSILGSFSAAKNVDNKTGQVYQKYNFAPIALFEIPEDPAKRRRQWLEPLAIQIDGIKSKYWEETPPMFTPEDGMHWTMAKMVVQSADGNIHETIVHVGMAHLLIEPFAIATKRRLPREHPLSVLLLPHFAATLFSNNFALGPLFDPKGPFYLLNSADQGELDIYAAKRMMEKTSVNFTFPAWIKRRKMGVEEFPAPFPYRDDGMLLWHPIRRWVEEYLQIYYGDSDRVQRERIRNDYELQAWIKELSSDNGGKIKWFGQFDGSFQMLTDFVACVVNEATAHHVMVHMPQMPIEMFVPAYPFALYKRPAGKGEPATMQHLLDMMPPMEMAVEQKRRTAIGGMYYGQLGQYGKGYFRDERVDRPLKHFLSALDEIKETLEQRNRERVGAWKGILPDEVAENWNYNFLNPADIPASINI